MKKAPFSTPIIQQLQDSTYPKENEYTYNTAGIHSETEDECMLEGGGNFTNRTIQPGDVIRTLENPSNFKLNRSARGLPKGEGLVP